MDLESAAGVPLSDLELIVRVRGHGREYLLNPKFLGIEHFGQLVSALQASETEAAAYRIVETAETVKAMYDLVFPGDGEAAGGPDEEEVLQQV